MTSALKHSDRTPEQEACWHEAMRLADERARNRGTPVSEQEANTLYLATLNRRLQEALEPINRAEIETANASPFPRPVTQSADGTVELSEWTPTWDREPFNKLRAPIIAAYTKGLA